MKAIVPWGEGIKIAWEPATTEIDSSLATSAILAGRELNCPKPAGGVDISQRAIGNVLSSLPI